MDSNSPSPLSTLKATLSNNATATPTPLENDKKDVTPKKIQWNDLDASAYSTYGAAYILLTSTLLYPSELLRTRLQADKFTNHKKIVVRKLFYDIYKREGVRGLYKGYGAATLGSFPAQLIYYFSYEYSNQLFLNNMPGFIKRSTSEDTQGKQCTNAGLHHSFSLL